MVKAKKETVKVDKTKMKVKIVKKKKGVVTSKLKKVIKQKPLSDNSQVVAKIKKEINATPRKDPKKIFGNLKKLGVKQGNEQNSSNWVILKTEDDKKPNLEEDESDDDSKSFMKSFVKAQSPVDRKQIKSGVRALFEYAEKVATESKKIELFADDERPIFLQITAIKVPNTPNRQIRFTLQHSMLANESEVCLIVKDMFKAKEHEETIEYFENLLRENGVTGIKTIMPFHQFKTEYGHEFELKRKLLGLYDHFLVDARISGYVVHLLGKIFLDKRKMPTPVNMEKGELKDRIDKALRTTLMKVHSKSDSFQVQVGNVNMSQEQVLENVMVVVDELDNDFPGGLDNVRALGLKTDKSISIPVYLTLKNKSTVNVPLAIPKLPKAFRNVTGELTTYMNRDITVLPSGEVIIHNKSRSDDKREVDEDLPLDSNDTLPKEDDSELINEVKEEYSKIRAKTSKRKKIKAEDTVKDEDATDDILAQAEEMYLNEYEQEQSLKKKKGKRTEKNRVINEKTPKGVNNNISEVNTHSKRKKKQKGKENVSDKLDDSENVTQEIQQKKGKKNKKHLTLEEGDENIKVEVATPNKRKLLQTPANDVSPSKILKKVVATTSSKQHKGTAMNRKENKPFANGIEIKQEKSSPPKKKKGDGNNLGKKYLSNATNTDKNSEDSQGKKGNLKNKGKKGKKKNSNKEILKVKIKKSIS